jgi:hypothetical protein
VIERAAAAPVRATPSRLYAIAAELDRTIKARQGILVLSLAAKPYKVGWR